MEGTSLFDLPEGMQVSQIQITEQGLVVEVVATSPTSRCPTCSAISDSIHCHYRRVLCDIPCVGRRVQLWMTVRKFTCRNPLCERKVFAERLPTFVKPWARMTIRYREHITALGLATSGKAGARLAARLGIVTTRQTILRRIMDLPDPPAESVLFLGVDDFSFLRGRRFGTILVNLETRHVVDLLPDRKAETAASWMRQYPDLMAVSRDRGGDYAAAAKASAPQATQHADRFQQGFTPPLALAHLEVEYLSLVPEAGDGAHAGGEAVPRRGGDTLSIRKASSLARISFIDIGTIIDAVDTIDNIEITCYTCEQKGARTMTTSDDPLVREIAALLRELVHALGEPTIAAWTELDFTLPQLKTLKVLAHEGSSSIGHLAERLGVGQPTASHLVERLVQAGLVERAEDPANRRRTLARLSSRGEELIGQLRGTRGEQLFVWLSELDATDLHALRQGLQALVRVARGRLSAPLADEPIT